METTWTADDICLSLVLFEMVVGEPPLRGEHWLR